MRTSIAIAGILGCGGCGGARPAPLVAAPAPAAVCAAEVTRASGGGDGYPSWTAAWRALRGDGGDPVPASDEAARQALCGSAGCPSAGPWLVEQTWDQYDLMVRADLIFATIAGELVVHPAIGGGVAGRCPWADVPTLTVPERGPVHLRIEHTVAIAEHAHLADDAITPCEPGTDACDEACFVAEVATIDRWFERGSGFELLSVERQAQAPTIPDRLWLEPDYQFATALTVDAATAIVTGAGCPGPIAIPRLALAAQPGCPGQLGGVIADVYEQPRCGPATHLRAEAGRPLCVPIAPCLVDDPVR